MVTCIGPDQLDRAAEALRTGRLVAFPTETVYGLGANALDAHAVARIFEAKGRPHFDPLIVHLTDPADARRYAAHWPDAAQRLAEAFWPGPLTIVVEKCQASGSGFQVHEEVSPLSSPELEPWHSTLIPDLVTAGLPTVALRVPGHALARELIRRAGVPVAAPSANRFGGVSPTRAAHVCEELGERVDVVLDGGPCETGVESTVVSVIDGGGDAPGAHRWESVGFGGGTSGGGVTVLRLGGLPVERIEAVVGSVRIATGEDAGEAGEGPDEAELAAARAGRQSPGMLARHYAPRTPLVVGGEFRASSFESLVADHQAERVGVLLFRDRPELRDQLETGNLEFEILSPQGELREAATNLFAALRRLDAAGLDLIVAETVPDHGLGRAINDRLRRASTRS